MPSSASYSISSTGGVVTGHQPESVIEEFCSVFGVKPEKAQAFVDKEKLIKKDLTEAQAFAYRDRLTEIGLPVALIKHEIEKSDEFAGLSLLPANDEPEPQTAAHGATPAPSASPNHSFSCPKCQLPQAKTEQCVGCGVFVEKFLAAQSNAVAGGASGARGKSSTAQSRSSHSRSAASSMDDNFEDPDSFLPAIGAAVVVAVVGAFLWKYLAVSFDTEYGIAAWAIGGAIGGAAAMLGGRGSAIGAICAILLIVAIAGGKYMAASAFIGTFVEEDLTENTEFIDMLSQMQIEAEEFASVGSDDSSIQDFMIKYEYTDSSTKSGITSQELANFKEYSAPMMREYHAEWVQSGSEDMSETFSNAIGTISTMAVFISMWGLLDILFLFLGAGTAFRLGSAGQD